MARTPIRGEDSRPWLACGPGWTGPTGSQLDNGPHGGMVEETRVVKETTGQLLFAFVNRSSIRRHASMSTQPLLADAAGTGSVFGSAQSVAVEPGF